MNIQQAKFLIKAAALADDTVLIEGAHGVGKSDIVRQVQVDDGYHLEVLFLSHMECGDLIGIPHIREINGESVTVWSKPVWLSRMDRAAKQGTKCLLFLDELNRAPLDVRQSAMQLVLERMIHEHHLPVVGGQRTVVVAAVNPPGEYQVDDLDPALLDRFLLAEVETDADTWLSWARKHNIHRSIIGFVSQHHDRLHWTPADGGFGSTPRSWAKLSKYLDQSDLYPTDVQFQIIRGKLGSEVGSQFFAYFQSYTNNVTAQEIETIVFDNAQRHNDVEELAKLVRSLVQDQEAVQKTELAEQLLTSGKKQSNMLALLAFLYAVDIEVCVAFLRKMRETANTEFAALVELDEQLNKKALFKRIIQKCT